MSSFSTKLARVNLGRMPGAPAAPGGAATDTRVELDPEERLHPSLRRQDDAHGDARRDAREADGFAAAPARGTSLDELRDRMARILSRQPAPPPPPQALTWQQAQTRAQAQALSSAAEPAAARKASGGG